MPFYSNQNTRQNPQLLDMANLQKSKPSVQAAKKNALIIIRKKIRLTKV
jgi:hypothetical protein